MALAHPPIIPWHTNTKLTWTTRLINYNIHKQTETRTWVSHTILYGRYDWLRIYAQVLILPSQIGSPQHGIPMVGMESHQQRGVPTLPEYQRKWKYNSGLSFKGLPPIKLIPHKYLETHTPTTYSGVIPHQNGPHRDYLLDIISISVFDTTKGIYKDTATNNYGSRYRWCTLLTHAGSEEKIPGWTPPWS